MRVLEQRRPKTTRGRKPRRTENARFCIGKNVRHIHARFGAAQTKNDSWTKASTHRECSVLHWQERPAHPCAFWSSADQKRLVDESLDAPRMLGSALARTSGTSMRVLEQRRPKTTRGRKPRRTENARFCIGKNVRTSMRVLEQRRPKTTRDESLDAPRMLGSALARTSGTSMRVLEQRRPKTTRGRKPRRTENARFKNVRHIHGVSEQRRPKTTRGRKLDAPRMLGSALARTSGTSMRVLEQRRPKTTRGRKPRRTENARFCIGKNVRHIHARFGAALTTTRGRKPRRTESRFCIGKNVRHIHARFGAAQTKNDSWTKASTHRECSVLHWQERPTHPCAFWSSADQKRLVDESLDAPRMLDVGRGRVERPGRRTRCGLTNPPAELYTDASWMFSDVSGMFLFFDP